MSAADASDIAAFYRDTVPADFNRSVEAQRALGEAGRRVLDDMLALDATIQVDVVDDHDSAAVKADGGDAGAHFYLNIAAGHMSAGAAPAHTPFLRIRQDPAAVRRFAREAGGSLTALLGALAGLGADMKLTRKRALAFEAIDGRVRFDVTGDAGFSLVTDFGPRVQPGDAPDAVLRMSDSAYAELRAGRIDPQTAFLDDTIESEGDMQKIMQIAFAVVAPD